MTDFAVSADWQNGQQARTAVGDEAGVADSDGVSVCGGATGSTEATKSVLG
eukprot:COSAG02_NODE_38109_length_433_cov_0.805389_1_plen_50_part_01